LQLRQNVELERYAIKRPVIAPRDYGFAAARAGALRKAENPFTPLQCAGAGDSFAAYATRSQARDANGSVPFPQIGCVPPRDSKSVIPSPSRAWRARTYAGADAGEDRATPFPL